MKPFFKHPEEQSTETSRCYLPMGLYYAVRNHPFLGIPAATIAPKDMFDWRFRLFTFLVVLPSSGADDPLGICRARDWYGDPC
jgi:hypothetical protein